MAAPEVAEKSPEAISALWSRLEALARTIEHEATRDRYLADWRSRFEALYPLPDADDPILPNGVVVSEATERERGRLAFVAARWWLREQKRLLDPKSNLKAIAHGLGRRISAGLIDREEAEAEIPPEIASRKQWDTAYRKGLKWPFSGQKQLLDMRLSQLPMTGFGMAERWFARSGHDFIYTTSKGWMAWDQRRWKVLDQEQNVLPAEVKASIFEAVRAVQEEARMVRYTGVPPQSLSQKTLDAYIAEGKALNDDGLNWNGRHAAILEDWGRSSESAATLGSVAAIAMQWMTRAIEQFDQEAMAVNCRNGTLRFTQRPDGSYAARLDPHNRADHFTRVAAVDYRPDAPAPLFKGLIKWAQPEVARRRYVRQWLGYNLTGHTGAQILHVWYGKGGNGKGSVIEACSHAMGDYSDSIGIESLLGQSVKRRGDAATPDLAKLTGVRLLRTAEPEEGDKLNEGLIKLVTGQDVMSVRGLFKGFFAFLPSFKLTIATNYPLKIKGTDDGIWRRLKQVGWDSKIEDADKDIDLPEKLKGEAEGILAWQVRGLLDWMEHGFVEPASVTEATRAWRDDSDPVGKFLNACTVDDKASRVQSSLLHDVFTAWAKVADEYEMKNKSLTQKLKQKGYEVKVSNGNHIMGLRLIKQVGDFVDEEGRPKKLDMGDDGARQDDDAGHAAAPLDDQDDFLPV